MKIPHLGLWHQKYSNTFELRATLNYILFLRSKLLINLDSLLC